MVDKDNNKNSQIELLTNRANHFQFRVQNFERHHPFNHYVIIPFVVFHHVRLRINLRERVHDMRAQVGINVLR